MVADRKVSKKTPTASNNRYMINIEQRYSLRILGSIGDYFLVFSRQSLARK